MPERTLGEWLTHLEQLHPNPIELGLTRVREVGQRLGLLEPDPDVVVIAGTNGKGSSSAVLEAIALDAGRRVGVFTSPHLLHYNERIRIDGAPVADAPIIAAFEAIDAARGDISLTYFEFGALAALWVFARQDLDLLVLEVGLGGRLDAVNIIDARVAVITSISLDHEAWLGSDRETIGGEKAGILRTGIDAVIADPDPTQSIRDRLRELECRASFYQAAEHGDLPGASALRPENVYAGREAAARLGLVLDDAHLRELVEGLVLPGRLQRCELDGHPVILDVAHNPAAIDNLLTWLEREVPGPRIALFAVLSDKDIHAMICPCSEAFAHWYLPALPGVQRALPGTEVKKVLEEAGAPSVTCCESLAEAWQQALASGVEGTVVVFGSFYTVAGFMELLGEGQDKA
ncbi:MAG: folylpolyglutamate synthase/dihydrofolate synthase family protein [Halieaceae bacterium]|nr:folylpolyglutamate synthase/dihydrofolate synthase family protein [Halieaceae bacterium]